MPTTTTPPGAMREGDALFDVQPDTEGGGLRLQILGHDPGRRTVRPLAHIRMSRDNAWETMRAMARIAGWPPEVGVVGGAGAPGPWAGFGAGGGGGAGGGAGGGTVGGGQGTVIGNARPGDGRAAGGGGGGGSSVR